MRPIPDFSPAMLKTFLYARAVARDGFAQSEAGQVAARRAVADELADRTGLPWSTIRAAFAGQLREAGARAAIWAALGHFPSDHGIVLDGPQERQKEAAA
jgi:hypothetical protein